MSKGRLRARWACPVAVISVACDIPSAALLLADRLDAATMGDRGGTR